MILIHKTTNYKAIQEIAAKTWPKTYSKILSPEQIDYMFAMMYDIEALKNQGEEKKHHFIIAEEGENLGFASYEFNYQNASKTKIHKIYVLPETQGKGIGKKLIDFILEEAKKNNQELLSLNVNRYNKAVDFYQKMDFKNVGEEDIDIGNGYLMEDYIMEKKV